MPARGRRGAAGRRCPSVSSRDLPTIGGSTRLIRGALACLPTQPAPIVTPPFSRRSGSAPQNEAMSQTALDFGYPWWLTYGHLALFGVLVAGLLAARAAG